VQAGRIARTTSRTQADAPAQTPTPDYNLKSEMGGKRIWPEGK